MKATSRMAIAPCAASQTVRIACPHVGIPGWEGHGQAHPSLSVTRSVRGLPSDGADNRERVGWVGAVTAHQSALVSAGLVPVKPLHHVGGGTDGQSRAECLRTGVLVEV